MKLSEAILEGCKLSPVKVQNVFYNEEGTCLLGAACVAMGVDLSKKPNCYDFEYCLQKNFGFVLGRPEAIQEAVERNNSTDESRESIAAWLATQGY